jgi:hypothetical protein
MPNFEERVVAWLTAQGRSPLSNTSIYAEGHSARPNTPISALPIKARSRSKGGKRGVLAAVLVGVFAIIICGWLARIEAQLLGLEATLATTSDQVAGLRAAPSSKPLPIVLVAPPPPTPASETLPLSLSHQALTAPKAHLPKKP